MFPSVFSNFNESIGEYEMREKISKLIGYPINVEKYKDKDAIVSFLTSEYLYSIRVNNGFLLGSKYSQATILFNKVSIDIGE